MVDDKLGRIDELTETELRSLLKQQVARTYLTVKTRNVNPFRYIVADDSMWFMYRDADMQVQRRVHENFTTTVESTMFTTKEHVRVAEAVREVISDPNQPQSGAREFYTKDGRKLRIEYETLLGEDGKVESMVGELVDVLRNEDTMSQTILSLNKRSEEILPLEQTYESIISINLHDYSFELIRCTPAVKEVASRLTNAIDLVKMMNTYDIAPEYRGLFIDFLDEKTLASRMAGKKFISQYFLSIHLGWIRVKIIPVTQDRMGNVERVLYVSERSAKPADNIILSQTSDLDALTGLLRIAAGRRLVESCFNSKQPFAMVQFRCDYYNSYVELLGNIVSEKILLNIGKALSFFYGSNNAIHIYKDSFGLVLAGDNYEKSNIPVDGGSTFIAQLNKKLTELPVEEMGGLPVKISGVAILFDGTKTFDYSNISAKLQLEVEALGEENCFKIVEP